VAEAEGKLAPSGVANLLRGASACDPVKADPKLLNLKHFGVAKDSEYGDLLPHVLAMCVKGYLCPSGEKSKKLVLTAKGREVLSRS
jgi:hypothetical protein